MPVILELPFINETAPSLELIHLPRYFLRYLAAVDPGRAVLLQHTSPPRPYTLSKFFYKGGQWQWRITFLQDDLADLFLDGVTVLQASECDENQLVLNTSKVITQETTYQSLLSTALPATSLRLRFLSPTSFRTRLTTYPLPDPVGMVQSWWERWNTFSREKLDCVLLDVAAVHLAVSSCKIRTRLVDLGVGQQIGFIGVVTLRVVKANKIGEDVLRHLNALAAYADFCGTGQRTAQGMGQTRCYKR